MSNENLRILVLEDDLERHAHFQKNMGVGNTLVTLEKADETIAKLKEEKWDMLFLDHDLGGKIMQESGPGTGYEVACWLEEFPQYTPEVVIIHSLNIYGAKKMQAAVKGSYLIPGVWFFTDLLEEWDKAKEIFDKNNRRLPSFDFENRGMLI